MKKTLIKKYSKVGLFIFLFLFLLISSTFSKASGFNSYDSDELINIVAQTNNYELSIKSFAKEFNIPENVLKSVFGVFTEQGISNVNEYDSNGKIGVMGLIPFMDNGQSYYYDQCLKSKCMASIVSDDLSVENKREAVKRDYSSFENSICCAAYIMNQINEMNAGVSVVFPKQDSQCFSLRSQATYTDWEGVVREYVGTGCINNDIHLYFIEKYSQLFEAFKTNDFTAYGILKFTPAFSIKAPVLINVYDDVRDFVTDTMKECKDDPTESCVKDQQQKFIDIHKNMSFIDFCEEPEINIINSIYDRLVNAYETQKDNCKYLIASQDPKLNVGNSTIITYGYSNPNSFLSDVINNVEKKYLLSNFNLPAIPFELYLEQKTEKDLIYTLHHSSITPKFKELYILKNSTNPYDQFIYKKIDLVGSAKFYDILNQEIDVSSYPTCQEKYKYFTCLDTNMTEQVFDWMTWSWKESVDTIKVKFAFQIPK